MVRLGIVLFITACESFASILIQRGVYFYAEDKLGWNDADNLWLALSLGSVYVVSAVVSHRVSDRFGERPVLVAALSGQLFCYAALLIQPDGVVLAVSATVFNGLSGFKWPVIESYVSAGRTPQQTKQAIGRFNMVWATAVPASLLVTGPIIQFWSPGLFVGGLSLTLVAIASSFKLPAIPEHLPDDHPERFDDEHLAHLHALTVSSRWSMLSTYALVALLNPLMPGIFKGLGFSVAIATALAAIVDVVRLITFWLLERFHGWHGKVSMLVIVFIGIPFGFAMMRFGGNIWIVIGGEVIIGIATGLSYYAALYYAMVVKNASVKAGAGHEAMIGSGFLIGPLAGIIAVKVGASNAIFGAAIGVGPLIGITAALGLWPLVKLMGRGDKVTR